MNEMVFYNRRGDAVAPAPGAIIRPRRAIYALLIQQEQALLIWPRFTDGIPDLPGGGIDEGESPDEALWREWREETGLEFPAAAKRKADYHHMRGFHAEDAGEFWIYDQSFRLYHYDAQLYGARRWDNPEGDEASWEPLTSLPHLSLNRAHWQAVGPWLTAMGISKAFML